MLVLIQAAHTCSLNVDRPVLKYVGPTFTAELDEGRMQTGTAAVVCVELSLLFLIN